MSNDRGPIKPRGAPINAPISMRKIRDKKRELNEAVMAGTMTAEDASAAFRAFGSSVIAHERDQYDAAHDIGPAIDPLPRTLGD